MTATATLDAPPVERQHFALFDALRGISVFAVLTYHVATITGALGNGYAGRLIEVAGPIAVTNFFVISGFLLYRPFVAARDRGAPPPSLRRFARRRALRLVPGYWVALTVLAVFPGLVGVFSGDFWRFYGFTQLYTRDTLGQGIAVAWTLCVEVTFYIALIVWARFSRAWSVRTDLLAMAAVAAVGVVLRVLAERRDIPHVWADALPGQGLWLVIGMALAIASVVVRRPPALVVHRPTLCWAGSLAAAAGLAALAPKGTNVYELIAQFNEPQPAGRTLARLALGVAVSALFVLPAVFGEHAGGLPRRILAWAPVAFLGTISYSFYLYHLTLAQLVGQDPDSFRLGGLDLKTRLDGFLVTPLVLLATVAVTVPIAAASYRWVERPFFQPRRPRR